MSFDIDLDPPPACVSGRDDLGGGARAATALTALAREEVTVVINGAEMVIDGVRDARHLGGAQRYFLCACGRRVWHLSLRADERPMCRRCAGNLDYRSRSTRRRGLNRVR